MTAYTTTQRAIFRLPSDGGEVYKAADVPPEFPFCKRLFGLPDGTVFLFASEDNLVGAEAALFRLAPGTSTLRTVALGLDADYGHAVRDSATLFRFGDAGFVTGVAHRRF